MNLEEIDHEKFEITKKLAIEMKKSSALFDLLLADVFTREEHQKFFQPVKKKMEELLKRQDELNKLKADVEKLESEFENLKTK